MTDDLPAPPDRETPNDGSNGNGERGNNFLAIGQFHYHGNDLSELRKLAEHNPELAEQLIRNSDKADQRSHLSYRFGLLVSFVLLIAIIVAVLAVIVLEGIWVATVIIAGILAVALLVRVILTGEWSDTSWFGRFVGFLAKTLGGKPD